MHEEKEKLSEGTKKLLQKDHYSFLEKNFTKVREYSEHIERCFREARTDHEIRCRLQALNGEMEIKSRKDMIENFLFRIRLEARQDKAERISAALRKTEKILQDDRREFMKGMESGIQAFDPEVFPIGYQSELERALEAIKAFNATQVKVMEDLRQSVELEFGTKISDDFSELV